MSKPPAKRKASDANLDAEAAPGNNQLLASLDLSNAKTKPKTIATALLSLLPDGATTTHPSSKKMTKAFTLVKAELDARANAMARASESQGTRQPIAFHFANGDSQAMTTIAIPEECFVNVMKFLNGRDIVNGISPVNKALLSVSRTPSLWERLDESAGLTNSGKKMNVSSLLKVLARPQFANLKHLSMPYKLKVGKPAIKKIADLCPHLETWDLGYSRSTVGGGDLELIEAAERFTKLSSVHTDMWKVTARGICALAESLGGQLQELRIAGDCITRHYVGDITLSVIADSCPNLKYFSYMMKYASSYYKEEQDPMSGDGVIALVNGCRRLEVLELKGAKRVERRHFLTIIQMVEQGRNSASARGTDSNGGERFALRKIEVGNYPFTIGDYPFQLTDNAETRTLSRAAFDVDALSNIR